MQDLPSGSGADLILLDVAAGVAIVTLNRPHVRNALNRPLRKALWDAISALEADPEVQVILLTGADPAFCAGMDLTELSHDAQVGRAQERAGGQRDHNGMFRYLPAISKPTIAAVNGDAVTGGLELALQCSFLIASDRARFADTHARMGIMPGGGLTVHLAQCIGTQRAVQMSITGGFLSADDALRLGLVNQVVPHAELLATGRALGAAISACDQSVTCRLLRHYQEIAAAPSPDAAFAMEARLADSWRRPEVIRTTHSEEP